MEPDICMVCHQAADHGHMFDCPIRIQGLVAEVEQLRAIVDTLTIHDQLSPPRTVCCDAFVTHNANPGSTGPYCETCNQYQPETKRGIVSHRYIGPWIVGEAPKDLSLPSTATENPKEDR